MNNSAEKEPNENDQQKQHTNIINSSLTINDSTSSTAEAVATDSVTTVAIIDDVDENLSDNSTEKDLNKNNKHERHADASTVLQTHSSSIDANLSNRSIGKKTDKIGQRRYTRIIRDGKRRYACKQCDKTYHRPDGVLLHIKTKHDGIRDHACKLCDKRCTSAYELRIHTRSHTGNKH